MTGIVRIALTRPYTFVVMAILMLMFRRACRRSGRRPTSSPTSAFPSFPWSGATRACRRTTCRAASSRSTSASLTTTVNDIEHIESQSLPGYGIVKIFFQPNVNITAAQAQVTSISQTILKQLPPGVTPPIMLVYNASSVPIIQLALSSDSLSQTELNDLAQNFIRPALATVPGAQLPYPYGGCGAAGADRSRPERACTPTASRPATSALRWRGRT